MAQRNIQPYQRNIQPMTPDEVSEFKGETVGGYFVNSVPVYLPPPERGQFGAPPQAFGPGASLGQATPQTSYKRDRWSLKDRALAALGVDVTADLGSKNIRTALGFGANDHFKIDFLAKKLEERNGIPGEKQVRFNQFGDIEFFNVPTGRWTPLDAKRLDMNDLRELYGPGITASGALMGGIVGSFVGGPFATSGGGGIGFLAGEMIRLQRGKEMGVHDLTFDEMLQEASKGSAIEAVAGLGGELTMGIWHRLKRIFKPTGVTEGQARQWLQELASGENQQLIEEINVILAKAGREERLTLPAVTVAGNEEGMELYTRYGQQTAETRAARLKELNEANTALDKAFRVRLGVDPDADIIWRQSRPNNPAQAALVAERQRIEQIAENSLQDFEYMAKDLLANMGRLDEPMAGQMIQRQLNIYSAAAKNTKTYYWNGYQRAIGQPLKTDPNFSAGTQFTSNIQIPVTNKLRDRVAAEKALRQASTLTGRTQGKAALRQYKPGSTVDLAVLDEDIKMLRSLLRESTGPNINKNAAKRALDDLVEMRNDYLTDPRNNLGNVFHMLEQAEAAETVYQDLVSRSYLGQVLKVNKFTGQFEADNVDAFRTLWGDKSGKAMRELVNVANELGPGGKQALQELGYQVYRANVVPSGGHVPSRDLHDKFVADNEHILRAIYNEPTFWRFGMFADNVEAAAARAKSTREALAKTPIAKIGGAHPEQMAKLVLSDSKSPTKNAVSIQDLVDTMKVLRRASPESVESFQEALGSELWRMMTIDGLPSTTKMSNVLRDNHEKLVEVFGSGYVNDLHKLRKMFLLTAPRTAAGGPEARGIWNFIGRIINPPMTRQGRVQSLGELLRRNAFNRAMNAALRDPKVLKEIVATRTQEKITARTVNLLSQLGAGQLAIGWEGDM